ncbi:5038_t:CDS:1, partial [Cetraspora pellucida]
MDEEIRRKYCGLLMFDVIPPSSLYNSNGKGNSSTLTIDHTTSLENSSIRTQDNFVFTSFLEPIRVKPQNPIKIKQPITSNVMVSDLNNDVKKDLVQPSSEDRTPRPPNAFILYRRAKQPEVTQKYGNISNAKISKILANLWRSETEDVKHYWQKMADKKKMEHMLAHPGYVYRPKKPGGNKKKKDRRKSKVKVSPKESPGPLIPLCDSPAQNSIVSDSSQVPAALS